MANKKKVKKGVERLCSCSCHTVPFWFITLWFWSRQFPGIYVTGLVVHHWCIHHESMLLCCDTQDPWNKAVLHQTAAKLPWIDYSTCTCNRLHRRCWQRVSWKNMNVVVCWFSGFSSVFGCVPNTLLFSNLHSHTFLARWEKSEQKTDRRTKKMLLLWKRLFRIRQLCSNLTRKQKTSN